MSLKTFITRYGLAWLLVPSVLLIITLCYLVLPRRTDSRSHQPVQDTIIKYIPHHAPDTALLGGYEEAEGPFIISVDSTTDVIIEDHSWKVDIDHLKYNSKATGYLLHQNPDGSTVTTPAEIEEQNDYDTLRTQHPARHHLPVVDISRTAPHHPAKKLPDTVYTSSRESNGVFNPDLWEIFKTRPLPFTHRLNGLDLFITERTITPLPGKTQPAIKIKVSGTMKQAGTTEAPAPFEMEREEPLP